MPKLRGSKSQTSRINYFNINYHSGLDGAHVYSALVDQHLTKSQRQNHVLSSAKRTYINQLCKVKSGRASHTSNPQQTKIPKVMTISKLHSKPQLKHQIDVFDIFEHQTLKLSEVQCLFTQREEQRKRLVKHIAQLKKNINHQKNIKAKVSLTSCKHMNKNQLTSYNTDKLLEESRRYNIELAQLTSDCALYKQNILDLQKKRSQIRANIEEESKTRQQYKQYVQKARMQLMELERQVVKIKSNETISYKLMTNDFMYLNILKEQKAKLLSYIEDDVNENKICKPFGKVI